MNKSRELVALLSGGISLRRLLFPLMAVGIAAMLLLYATQEIQALYSIGKHSSKYHKQKTGGVRSLKLTNGSTLLYQTYEPVTSLFFDLVWIESPESIWRAEQLQGTDGKNIEHFVKEKNGFVLKEHRERGNFPTLQFDLKLLNTAYEGAEKTLPMLLHETLLTDPLSERGAKLQTSLYSKLLSPWIALIAVLIPIPFCIRFSRELPEFLIWAGSLCALQALFILVDAGIILGERQTLNPAFALGVPFAIAFFVSGFRVIRAQ
jgi:lipopolysaccharide export system permease protein